MMLRADGLGRVFGFRRKKTLADRVQDVADDLLDVVDKAAMSAREAYVTTLASATPVLAKSSKTAGKTAGKAIAESSKTAGKTAGRVRLLSGRAADKADKAADRARDAYESTVEAAGPLLARSSRTADRAWSKTAERTAHGLSTAREASATAGTAAAATGVAAAGAVGGFFGALRAFFGSLFRGVWGLTVFLLKAAILAGIAYAGWQWLQSRQQNQQWNPPPYTPPSAPDGATFSSTAGPAPAVR